MPIIIYVYKSKIFKMSNLKLTIRVLFLFLFMIESTNAQDWANLTRFKDENSKLELPSTNENRIVFMGNSITESWAAMCPEFFANNSFVNRGISGQTSPQMLLRFRADVIQLKPVVVVILAGTNDIAGNTGPSTIEMIENNIISMAELATANNIKVILSSVLPVFDYPWKPGLEPSEKIVSLNKKIKDYANKNNMIYLDYFKAMATEQNGLKEAFTYDGVHPNKEGYLVMEPLVMKAIAKVLSID